MKIAAVLVTYKRLEKLKKAIASIKDQEINYLIIVNNASQDDTEIYLEKLSQSDSKIHIVNLPENTGGAGGFYAGSKYACENTDADWLLFFDDDAYAAEDLILEFRIIDHKPEVQAYSSAVYKPDGAISDFNRPGINPFKSLSGFIKFLRSGPYLGYEDLKNSKELFVDYSSFVGFFICTEIIKKDLGYPDPEFFIYCDDWSYTLKLSKLNYKNQYRSNLVFIHDSETFIDNYDKQIWKKYYAYRNSLHFYKEASGIFFPLVFFLKLIKWLTETRLYKNKSEYLKTLVRASLDGFTLASKLKKKDRE
jgi:GT2 family glycosyltransferase